LNLILIDEMPAGGRAVLRDARARHAREVLGVAVGDELRVGVVRGPRGSARVEAVGDEVVLACTLEDGVAAAPAVDVILAVPRPKVLSRTLEALASFGVRRVDLVNAWRVDKSYFGSPRLIGAEIDAALRLGCEQGSTTWLPEAAVHPLLVPFLDEVLAPRLAAEPRRRRLLAHPEAPGLEQALPAGAEEVVVAIGPEGGWIASELASFAALGFHMVAIAPAVLRTETAAAALLGQLALWRRL
jgi:16S rRNA (uracil1498-N3)-methyltransferase